MCYKKIKGFYLYVIPSIITMLFGGVYSMVDGYFVGNAIGEYALGSIYIAYPIQVFLNAVAIGIGIGGSIQLSYYQGKRDYKKEKRVLGNIIILLMILGICLPFLCLVFHKQLLIFLRAKGQLFEGAQCYISIILSGGFFLMLSNGLNSILRNQQKVTSATKAMCLGLIVNIILDYLLVYRWKMGIVAAALATVIAQAIVAVCSLMSLSKILYECFRWKSFNISKKIMKRILLNSISPFGQVFLNSVAIIMMNWLCIYYGGNDAITIFSVLSYIITCAQLVLQGICEGIQPLISYWYGVQDHVQITQLLNKAKILSILFSLSFCVICIYNQSRIIDLFHINTDLYTRMKIAILFHVVALPFFGYVKLMSAYFSAICNSKFSTLLVYIETCIVLPVFLLVFSRWFQESGIWIASFISQFTMFIIAYYLQLYANKQKKKFS